MLQCLSQWAGLYSGRVNPRRQCMYLRWWTDKGWISCCHLSQSLIGIGCIMSIRWFLVRIDAGITCDMWAGLQLRDQSEATARWTSPVIYECRWRIELLLFVERSCISAYYLWSVVGKEMKHSLLVDHGQESVVGIFRYLVRSRCYPGLRILHFTG